MEISNVNSLTNVGNINLKKTKPACNLTFKADSFENQNLFDEHLTFKQERLLCPDQQIRGSINNKVAYLKQTNCTGFFNKTSDIKGKLGESQINLKYQTGLKGTFFNGTFEDKEINIKIKHDLLKGTTMYGTINDQEFSVSFPGEITELSKENADLITTLLSISGSKIKTKNGQFARVGLSDNAEQELELQMAAQAAQMQQMQMQQMMAGTMVPGMPPGML